VRAVHERYSTPADIATTIPSGDRSAGDTRSEGRGVRQDVAGAKDHTERSPVAPAWSQARSVQLNINALASASRRRPRVPHAHVVEVAEAYAQADSRASPDGGVDTDPEDRDGVRHPELPAAIAAAREGRAAAAVWISVTNRRLSRADADNRRRSILGVDRARPTHARRCQVLARAKEMRPYVAIIASIAVLTSCHPNARTGERVRRLDEDCGCTRAAARVRAGRHKLNIAGLAAATPSTRRR